MASTSEGYEPIPDVEAGIVSEASKKQSLEEKYPDANELERTFLGTLDDAMEKAKPEVSIPKFAASQVGPPAHPREFLESIVTPTIAFVISVGSAIVVAVMASPLAMKLFPYYTGLLTIGGSILPMKKAAETRSNSIFDNIDAKEKQVRDLVDGVSSTALGYIDTSENTLDKALAPARDKLDNATKLEKMLRKIDPTVDIPDPKDIEEAFDGFTDKIKGCLETVNSAVNVRDKLPLPLRSKNEFFLYVFLPIVVVFLAVQFLLIYLSQSGTPEAEESTTTTNARLLRYLVADTSSDAFKDRIKLILISVQVYAQSVVQMVIYYVSTLPQFIILPMNKFVTKVETDANEVLDKHAGPIFKSIFMDGFGSVKKKMLEFIAKMEKIEGPLEKAQKSMNVGNFASSLTSKLGGSGSKGGSNAAAAAAADKAEDAKKAMSQSLGNASKSMTKSFKKFGL